MEKENGKVIEALPNGQFMVEIGGRNVRCYTSGKMRLHKIKIIIGDTVECVLDGYGNIGRITRRK